MLKQCKNLRILLYIPVTESVRARTMIRSISNFIGGGGAGSGEVTGYENAPYTVINTFQARNYTLK